MSVVTYIGFRHFMTHNWCAKCSACGKVLTKFAFTEHDARVEAESADHRCRKVPA